MDSATNLLSFIQYSKPDYVTAPHHQKITDALEALARREVDRLAIFMPPRHGKSEIASRRFPAWYIGRHPRNQIICASYSGDLATDFGREVRNIVRDREFRNVFPDVELSADSSAANRWHTNKGGIYVATGVGGSLTGRGAHIALIDDPVKDQQDADSELMRDRTWDWYVSVLRTRMMPAGGMALIQTRWHEDDLAGRILNSKEAKRWTVISMPAIADGKALWPEAYDVDELESIRSLDVRKFSALYQQNPTPEEGTFFRREWFKFYDPAKPPQGNKYVTSDFAVTEGDGDYTEIATHIVTPDDELYLAARSWRGQTSADVWIDRACDQILAEKPLCFFGESGPIRRSVEPFLTKRMRERKAYCRVEWLPSIADKPTRARSLQARAAMGKVFLPDNEYGHILLSQLLNFPAGMRDDAVDMAGMLGRAIDEAHPGVVPAVDRRKARDPYEVDDDNESTSWKAA